MITTAQAVMSLRPGVEWSMDGEDVENINWITPNVAPLTRDEIDIEIARMESEAQAKAVADAANAAAAIAHAKSLGFTDAMISAMYPALVSVAP